MKHNVTTFAVALLASLVLSWQALADVDFGDNKSETLTTKAWKAYGSEKYDDTLAYTAKCLELYEKEAKKMQEGLKELPANEAKEDTFKRWALNDVGTCLFIKGETLLKKGDKKGAKEAFNKLVNEFKFAQCWDDKGWFWKPADAAKEKLAELESGEKK